MPWTTPTLDDVRSLNRDNIQSKLRSGPMIPNSGLRVMADANADLAFLTLIYIDWLSRQLLPDTAEADWLDRHAAIWLPNNGRKAATYANGTATATGIAGITVPAGSILSGDNGTSFQTTAQIILGSSPTNVNIIALQAGVSNLTVGNTLSFSPGIAGVDGSVTITVYNDGVNEETDDELRVRVLDRIQEPPMGGDASDYEQWALQVPGVTRAWAAPNEMGIGTVTVRFMMDDLRATSNPSTNGFPNSGDVATVLAYLNTKRPVAIKDFFVVAPIPEPINFTLSGLYAADPATQNNINASVTQMLKKRAAPGHALNGVLQSAQAIYAAWVSEAVSNSAGVQYFDLVMSDHIMPSNGSLAVMGTISYIG